MNTDALDRLEQLFRAARLHAPDERAAFLDAACADDPALRAEIESLLAADAAADEDAFLDQPPADWEEALRTAADPLDGAMVGPYRIVRRLGHGGMGDVYLGLREQPFRRYVALKVLREGAASRDVLARFTVERQILASLDHPGIARLVDGGLTEHGLPYLAMDYVEGRPITAYCDERKLSIPERLRLFVQVCDAVHYAHQNLVLHRDLKPSNIFVSARGEVKLLDFGIAKLLNPHLGPLPVPVTRDEQRFLTPEYASPEQVRGEPLNTASDVYALGVLFYELLTGRRPHHLAGRSTHDIIRILSETEPERPSTRVTRAEPSEEPENNDSLAPADVAEARRLSPERLQRRLKGDLDAITLKALRKEPERRYASAEQLGEDIARHLRGQPVLAHRDSRAYRLGKFIRRHRMETASAVAVVLLLLGIALFSSWHARTVAAERDRAEEEHAKAQEVVHFLEGLFAASDPYAPVPERLDTLQIQAFLARGVDRVRTGFAGQPAVRAQMFDVVGRVYRSLGLYDEARPLLEEALETRRSALGARHPDVAESLTNLAALLLDLGTYEEAQVLVEEALAINTHVWDDEHPSIAEGLDRLAAILRERGLYDAAERRHVEAIAMLRRTAGDGDPRLASFMTNLVATLEWEGDYASAEQYARESVRLHRASLGDSHPRLALALRELGLLLQRRGAYSEAEALFREALGIAEEALGGEHPQIADLLNRIASVRWWQRDLAAADSIHRQSIALKRRIYGNEHVEVAYGLNNLASVLRDRGDYEEAAALHREALDVARATVGPEHSTYWILLGNLGLTTAVRGDCPEAERLLRDSSAGLRRTIPHEHIRVALNQQALGGCLTTMSRYEEAEAELLASYATLRGERNDDDRFLRKTADRLAELYTAWNRPDDAARYRTLALGSPDG